MVDPQTKARQLIVQTDHPRFGMIDQLASPVRVGAQQQVRHHRAPQLNEHMAEVLREILGYDSNTISSLVKDGAFGQA
jgi:crotonobetainyl-CoA:carnitine CoA-transferase CaiB-like acyl-CoA transferase